MMKHANMAPSGKSADLRGWPAKRIIHDTVPSSATYERPKFILRTMCPRSDAKRGGEIFFGRIVLSEEAGPVAGSEGKLG